MNTLNKIFSFLAILSCGVVLSSCYVEDPGALREAEQQYSVKDFDRLEMGSGFNITVTRGEEFNISAEGDERNLDDLNVRKDGNKLIIDFHGRQNRKHETYINIVMPSLNAVKFSGASNSQVTGFSGSSLDYSLSGASKSQIDVDAIDINLQLSGASHLKISGNADALDAEISGASVLSAYDLQVGEAHIHASGASEAKVNVSDNLHASASGASTIIYRGSPNVTSNTSGASSIHHD